MYPRGQSQAEPEWHNNASARNQHGCPSGFAEMSEVELHADQKHDENKPYLAQNAEVRLVWANEHLCLEISDDGRGFDPAAIPAGHLGIGFMQERAAAIGASLCIDSQRGAGTKVTIRWPR